MLFTQPVITLNWTGHRLFSFNLMIAALGQCSSVPGSFNMNSSSSLSLREWMVITVVSSCSRWEGCLREQGLCPKQDGWGVLKRWDLNLAIWAWEASLFTLLIHCALTLEKDIFHSYKESRKEPMSMSFCSKCSELAFPSRWILIKISLGIHTVSFLSAF